MNRFFAKKENDTIVLDEESLHHLRSVLRLQKGENIELIIDGSLFRAKIDSLDPFRVTALEDVIENRETSLSVLLGFALLKGGHDDLVVQKGTELGVKEFFPLSSERTIVLLREGKDKQKKNERFFKIARGASEQSKRLVAPIVHGVSSFIDALMVEAEHKYIAYEGEAMNSNSLYKELSSLQKGERVYVLIGPEGGWSEKEVILAQNHGFKAISLGKRILRAETASIYCASLLGAYGDEL